MARVALRAPRPESGAGAADRRRQSARLRAVIALDDEEVGRRVTRIADRLRRLVLRVAEAVERRLIARELDDDVAGARLALDRLGLPPRTRNLRAEAGERLGIRLDVAARRPPGRTHRRARSSSPSPCLPSSTSAPRSRRRSHRARLPRGSAAAVTGRADDKVVGARGDRLGRRHDALLVAAPPHRPAARPASRSAMSGPTISRTAATSCGEQTMPSMPASLRIARRAPRPAPPCSAA